MNRKFLMTSITVSTLCIASLATAGVLQKTDVPADAKWLAHFDNEAYQASQLGKLIAAERGLQDSRPGLAFLKETLQVDPAKDVLGVTLYGKAYGDENAVAIIRSTISESQLLPLLKQNKTHKSEAHGRLTIHSWTDKHSGQPAAGMFFDADTIIMAKTPALVAAAADVLDGQGATLAGQDAELTIPQPAPGVFLLAGATQCQGKLRPQANAQVVSHADNMVLAAAAAGQQVQMELQIGATSVEKAVQMENIVRGILALMSLNADNNPPLAAMAQAVTIQTTDKIMAVNLTCTAEQFIAFLQNQARMRHGAVGRHGRQRARTSPDHDGK